MFAFDRLYAKLNIGHEIAGGQTIGIFGEKGKNG